MYDRYTIYVCIRYDLPQPLRTVLVVLLDSAQLSEVDESLSHLEGTRQTLGGSRSCFGCPIQLWTYCLWLHAWNDDILVLLYRVVVQPLPYPRRERHSGCVLAYYPIHTGQHRYLTLSVVRVCQCGAWSCRVWVWHIQNLTGVASIPFLCRPRWENAPVPNVPISWLAELGSIVMRLRKALIFHLILNLDVRERERERRSYTERRVQREEPRWRRTTCRFTSKIRTCCSSGWRSSLQAGQRASSASLVATTCQHVWQMSCSSLPGLLACWKQTREQKLTTYHIT